MKVRTTIAGAAPRVRLTVAGWGALAILASAAVAGCTSASSSSTPSGTSSPSVTASDGGSAGTDSPSSGASGGTSPSTLPTFTASPTTSPSVTYSPPTTESPTAYPTIAPATGGGGTAGFQDALLLGVGAAAIVAGAGSIVYRRRLTRHR